MNALWIAAILGAVSLADVQAAECKSTSEGLTVFVEEKLNIGLVLLRAEGTASRIFAGIGLPVVWCHEPAPRNQTQRGIVMNVKILDHAIDKASKEAMGTAWPYEGSRIDIFYDRIAWAEDRPGFASVFLGHVLAHEITHNLQGLERHSKTGIMKGRWNAYDLSAISMRRLFFEPEDIALIQLGIKRRLAPEYRAAAGNRALNNTPAVGLHPLIP